MDNGKSQNIVNLSQENQPIPKTGMQGVEHKKNYWIASTFVFATLFLVTAVCLILLLVLNSRTLTSKQTISNFSDIPVEVEETQTKSSSNVFASLPVELQVKEPGVNIEANQGFFVINSILSNNKNKIVYSEISDCISQLNTSDSIGQCDWKYRIYVKDVSSGQPKMLYGYPENKLSLSNIFVKKAYAGGCPLVYLPIGWSKNDSKIVLKSVNPTSCGAGGGTTKYLYAGVNSTGGQVEGISNSQTEFYDTFSKAVFTGPSEKSPATCGPSLQRNNGKIVFFNVETGTTIKEIENPNTEYIIKEILQDKRQISYLAVPVIETGDCGDISSSPAGAKQIADLP